MATNEKKQLQEALDATVKSALKGDIEQDKETILQEMRKAAPVQQKKRKTFVKIRGGSDVYTQDVNTKLQLERNEKIKISKNVQKLISMYQLRKQQKMNRNIKIECFDKAIVKMKKYDPKYGLCAVCEYGSGSDIHHILIPLDKFTELTEEEMKSQLRISPSAYIERKFETTVDFYVEGHISKTDTTPEYFLGNRVDAMKDIKERYWFSYEIDGDSKSYRFNEGSIIEARVVGAFPKGILVEIFGVESYIPAHEVSWQRIDDVRTIEDIRLGGNVFVKILRLSRDEDTLDVSYSASIKQTKPDPMEKAIQIYSPGMVVTGKVSMIRWNENDIMKSVVIVSLPYDADVYCRFSDKPVSVGQKVTVTIGEIRGRDKAGRPYMHARIKHVENERFMDSIY